ncbi:hypothetical protein TWF106_010209 [Orbilia oligospora]|uniref:F-box domain-containing protein n=2 Tax=Orbilia oligospora TaxID=2813651 RepID=A0A6G1MJU9_ORBOL|nr:hypothetical protein TWF106_010209 [Orbilia oligospora]KAF3226949.1 hypothetical protein TWF191_004310 [Orbilia oligospora]KAF3261601.1 hypothetical protein TWF192_008066 [Orbilia oligospora]
MMPKSREKSTLEELPLDLKIDILRSLGSIYDLESLGLTCRTFYNICKSPQCTATAYRQLLIHGDHGELLRGVAVLRAYGRDDQLKLLQDASGFPANNPTDNTEYFYKLLSYQRTVRWFTNRFFEAMADKYGDVPPNPTNSMDSKPSKRFIPSRTESQRLDNAFLIFWILAETIYLFENRKPHGTIDGSHIDEELFTNTDRYTFVYILLWQILGTSDGLKLQLSVDFSVICSVARFLSGSTTPMALRYADTLSHEKVAAISSKLGCPDIYNRQGISNLLTWNLGLDGLQKFLEEKDETIQASVIGKYYNRPLEPRVEVDDEEPFKFFISCFYSLIDGVWIYMRDHSGYLGNIHWRPLWRESGIINLLLVPPWNQADEFDIDAAFCDDERLQRLGYFRPRISVDGEETDQSSLEEKMKTDLVCHCKEDWGCWD